MIVATVEFPNGARIHLERGRWFAEPPCYDYIAEDANYWGEAPYAPNEVQARAEMVAKKLGGKVVYYLPLVHREGDGPDTIY
jgi:hypothetical protein